MKKFLLSTLIMTLLVTASFQGNVLASTMSPDSNVIINNDNGTSQKNILKNAGIDTTKVNIVDIKDSFSKEELNNLNKETEKQDKLEQANGFTRTSTIVTTPKEVVASKSTNALKQSSYVYFVEVVDTYTSDEEILNSKSKGMNYWLDVSWNLTIGSRTKYVWKAATILGINPSNYLSSYHSGDKLSSTRTKVVKRKCYKKYNSIMNYDVWYLETRSETIKNYVDLYTFDKYDNSVRESETDKKTFYSTHYSNIDWVNNYVTNACAQNKQVPYIDTIA